MKAWLRRILLSLVLVLAAGFIAYRWLGYSSGGTKATLLYTENASYAIRYQEIARTLTNRGVSSSAHLVQDWQTEGIRAIARGASVVVIGIDVTPTSYRLLDYAAQKDASLFFVGTYPGDEYLSHYDKAYYVGSRIEYAGELAGKEMAQLFTEDPTIDLNGNLLLDYLVASDHPDFPLFPYTLEECEHYGVYVQNVFPPLPPEDVLDGTPDPHWTDCTVQPEVLLCGSFSDLKKAIELVQANNWTDVPLISFMSTSQEAEQAVAMGCDAIVYYDTISIGNSVVTLIQHLVQRESIAEGLTFAPNAYGAVWLPYQLYAVPHESTPQPTALPVDESKTPDSAA